MITQSLRDMTFISSTLRRHNGEVPPDISSQSLGIYTKVVLVAVNYIFIVSKYYLAHKTKGEGQLPPAYPSFIPVIGNFLLLLWDNEHFRRLTSYRGTPTAARIGAFGHNVYPSFPGSSKHQADSGEAHPFQAPSRFHWRRTQVHTESHYAGRQHHPGKQTSGLPRRTMNFSAHFQPSGPGLKPTFQRFKGALERDVDRVEEGDR
ncbi:hypothetical protein GGS20DRAFT_590144 [Poronia punctata]|nr:hypothetical protein GGS20DRAFT_590144 [Poronia punctata]